MGLHQASCMMVMITRWSDVVQCQTLTKLFSDACITSFPIIDANYFPTLCDSFLIKVVCKLSLMAAAAKVESNDDSDARHSNAELGAGVLIAAIDDSICKENFIKGEEEFRLFSITADWKINEKGNTLIIFFAHVQISCPKPVFRRWHLLRWMDGRFRFSTGLSPLATTRPTFLSLWPTAAIIRTPTNCCPVDHRRPFR